MSEEELAQIRVGAEISQYAPYIRDDLDKMKKVVVNGVMMHINAGTLTPEIAQSKWMEYASYERLSQRVKQKITVGQELAKGVKE